jgi:hypothetical protein
VEEFGSSFVTCAIAGGYVPCPYEDRICTFLGAYAPLGDQKPHSEEHCQAHAHQNPDSELHTLHGHPSCATSNAKVGKIAIPASNYNAL